MKKLFALLFVATAALSAFNASAQDIWNADKAHSKLGFVVTHLMINDVEGSFRNFEATINSSKPDFTDAVINLSADVNSVDTQVDKRDEHLRSVDFFDVEKYPKLTFKSTSIQKVANNKYKVAGQLTFHGVTKPIVLDATLRGTTVNQAKKTIAGFKITGKVKRSDYALGGKFPAAMLSEEVEIYANTEFIKN